VLESEADRLGMIKAVGGEEFDTGHPENLWAVFDIPTVDSGGLPIPARSRKPEISCRESDIVAHSIVKQTPLIRVATGVHYVVREFEHDGTGMSVIYLGT
jgi:hypothetical protein